MRKKGAPMSTRSGIAVIVSLVPLASLLSSAQPKYRIPLTVTDSSATLHSVTAYFGIHPDATNCIDVNDMTGFTDHWNDLFVFALPYTSDTPEYDAPPQPFATDIRI